MHTLGLLLSKNWISVYYFCYFINSCEIKICQNLWAYFTLKSSWPTKGAGKNVEPQNNVCP